MARGNSRGNSNRGRGYRGGPSTSDTNQGRGCGFGRGFRKGKGRADFSPEDSSVIDFPVQIWREYDGYDSNRGSFTPTTNRGRGRGYNGRGKNNNSTPASRANTPSRGRGNRGPFDGGRKHAGLGSPSQPVRQKPKSKLAKDAPLSSILYETRPLLRPVVFVKSTLTPFLFQLEGELLKPGVEAAGVVEESHMPTADRVAQVFKGMILGDAGSGDSGEEELEEIDFNDTEKLLEVAAKPTKKSKQVKEGVTGIYHKPDTSPSITHTQKATPAPVQGRVAETATASSSIPVNDLTQHLGDVLMDTRGTETGKANSIPPPLETRASDDVVYLVQDSGPPGGGKVGSPASRMTPRVEPTLDAADTPMPPISAANTIAPDVANVNVVGQRLGGHGAGPIEPFKVAADHYAAPVDPPEAAFHDISPLQTKIANVYTSDGRKPALDAKGAVPTKPPEAAGFYIDTTPAHTPSTTERLIQPTTSTISNILGAPEPLDDDDDVIVYVAPHPRSGRATPAFAGPSKPSALPAFPTTSILTGLSTIRESSPPPEVDVRPARRTEIPASQTPTPARFTPAQKPRQFVSPLLFASPSTRRKAKLRVRRHEARLDKRKKGKRSMFSFAAARQEKEWQDLGERDPMLDERRRGDSDIDWGDEDEQMQDRATSGPEGMDIDLDLVDEKSLEAAQSFAAGMLGQERSRFMTMDDIADADKLLEEDEASLGGAEGSSGEDELEILSPEGQREIASDNEGEDEESKGESDDEGDDDDELAAALEEEEERMIGEDEEDVSSDDDLSPRSSFHARLDRMRKFTRMRQVDTSVELPKPYTLEEAYALDEEDDFDDFGDWAENDDDLLQHLEDILDKNEAILSGRDRKQRNRLFKAISNGNYDDLAEFTVVKRKKDKAKGLPPSLQEQWEKDREKKAQFKAARELAKLEAAADPLVKKKGGKKGRKAARTAAAAAAHLDPRITVIAANRVIDMASLVQKIRRFLANPGGPSTMALPPANKYTRKLVHEMAIAFNLKSKSRGLGVSRYTTLIRTSRSGFSVDERKVSQIVRRSERGTFSDGDDDDGGGGGKQNGKRKGKGKGGGGGPLRQKEGEEVGKTAPKIDSTNVGFKMLTAMGWSDGNRIGVTGGLDKPLTAIIKHSKLGLGAMRQ